MADREVPYETALRVVGRHLDELQVQGVRLMELHDGFAVRCRLASNSQTQVEYFGTDRLQRDQSMMKAGRAVDGHADPIQSGYEDTLRAVGHELDDVAARDILVDEMDHITLVRYQFVHGVTQGWTQERMTTLEDVEMQLLLREARMRRLNGRRPTGGQSDVISARSTRGVLFQLGAGPSPERKIRPSQHVPAC